MWNVPALHRLQPSPEINPSNGQRSKDGDQSQIQCLLHAPGSYSDLVLSRASLFEIYSNTPFVSFGAVCPCLKLSSPLREVCSLLCSRVNGLLLVTASFEWCGPLLICDPFRVVCFCFSNSGVLLSSLLVFPLWSLWTALLLFLKLC